MRRVRRKKAPEMALVIRAKIYERDGWRCQICRRKVKRGATLPHPKAPTLDHIIPLAQGGTHEPVNCQLACYRCNCLKGDRTAPAGDQLRLIG